jgi:predicted nucleic acid-binding protein
MAERYLIDTSAVIKYLNVTFSEKGISFIDSIIDEECIISFISEIELQAWKPANPADLIIYKEFIDGSKIISITDEIIKKKIEIRRDQKLKIPDAIIAATSIANNFTLVSDNDKDFNKVPLLKYRNPATII